MSGGGGVQAPALADPTPIPIEVETRKVEEDIRKRLSRATGRFKSTAAGFLTTPPIVSNLALSDVLGQRIG